MIAMLESFDPGFRANVEREMREKIRLLTERVFLVGMHRGIAQAVAVYLERDHSFSKLVPNDVRIVPPLVVSETQREMRFVSSEGVMDGHQAKTRLAEYGCRPAQLAEVVALLVEHQELDHGIKLVVTGTLFDWASIAERSFPCFVWGVRYDRWVLVQSTFEELLKNDFFAPIPVLVGVMDDATLSSVA